jgi:hypothetical protein
MGQENEGNENGVQADRHHPAFGGKALTSQQARGIDVLALAAVRKSQCTFSSWSIFALMVSLGWAPIT